MKTLMTVVFLLVLIVIGTGFYRGWFAVSSPDAVNGDNKSELRLTVDQGKIKADSDALKDKTRELSEKVGGSDK